MTEVLITAGGTVEPIDDVRGITNFSGGAFGHELARAYAEAGHEVTLLSPRSTIDRFGMIDDVRHEYFTSTADLQRQIRLAKSARLVLHAAAVSDYSPVRSEGKLSSDEDELIIRLKRNPKLIADFREQFGPEAVLVGFKLLSGVADDALLAAADRQIRTNGTDFCIANKLEDISADGIRRVVLLSRSGETKELKGETKEVAALVRSHVGERRPTA